MTCMVTRRLIPFYAPERMRTSANVQRPLAFGRNPEIGALAWGPAGRVTARIRVCAALMAAPADVTKCERRALAATNLRDASPCRGQS
jgi:hypothetical protein